MDNSGSPNQDNATKKSIFDDLSRDELINKCKGLLAIAQKSKQSKNELQVEVESYKLQLEKCNTEKKSSQDNVQTLQELVASLTEQKLNHITKIDAAESKIKLLTDKCVSYEEELKNIKVDCLEKEKQNYEFSKNISDLDSKVISLKRQNDRLLEENEQLITQLGELEAQTAQFGLQQREQLCALEEKVQADEQYKLLIEELTNRIKELESKLENTNLANIKQDESPVDNKLKDLREKIESEKVKNEKAHIKLRSYKDKILKCAACINQLKNSRYILEKTVKEYSENIPKWQNDIINASKVLDDQINKLNNENKILKEELLLLKNKNLPDEENIEMPELKLVITENNKLKGKLIELQNHLQDNIESKTVLVNENKILKLKLDQLQIDKSNPTLIEGLKTEISNLHKELQERSAAYTNLECEKETLLSRLSDLDKQLQENITGNATLGKDKESLEQDIIDWQKQLQESQAAYKEVMEKLMESELKCKEVKEIQLPAHVKEIESLRSKLDEMVKQGNEVNKRNKELIDKVEELKTKNASLVKAVQSKNENNEVIESLNLQIKALESEKATLVKEKLNARDSIVELESINKNLSDQINNIRTEVQTLRTDLQTLSQEKAAMETTYKNGKEEELNNLKLRLKTLQEENELFKKELGNLQDLNGLLKEEVETLKLSLEQPRDDAENLSDLNVSLQADIVKLETKLSSYKQENASLLVEVKESRAKVKEFDTLLAEYEDMKSKMSAYKTENTELLNEMKEVNEVLKERGEAISKLQKAINEMERLIETLETDRDSASKEKDELMKKVESLESDLKNAQLLTNKTTNPFEQIIDERDKAIQALADKETLIVSLKDEIEKFKQQTSIVSAELPNEDMSTSTTISKSEEHARMKDLDETFEEKYTKLRIFALKLKKKLNDATSQLQNAEQDKVRLEKLLNDYEGKEPITVPTISVDQVDNVPKVGEGDGIKSDQITELESKVKSLTLAVEASEKIALELGKVKAELHSKTEELTSEVEAHKATKESLEKARRDLKKKNVLSLEMEDYERSMKDLTAKMDESKKKIIQMESTIDTQESTITAMKTQIKLLEEQIKAEESQTRSIKEELQNTLDESKEKDNIIQTKNNIIQELERDLEDEKRKSEEVGLETTSILSEKQKIIMLLGEEKIELTNKLKKVEFKCAELNEMLHITNMELADLKTEYTSYKVRAQAVLRQNQTVDHSQEEHLKEEAAALRAQIETLTAKLTKAQERLSEQTSEMEASRRRAAEAASEATRAQQRTARLQGDLARLTQQIESDKTQHKLQVTTLTQCYKTQINELEARLQSETEALRKQVAAAQELAGAARVVTADDANRNQYMVPVIPREDSDGEMDINVSMIPREEGEGSEAAPSPPLSKSFLTGAGSSRSPVPLERLLEEGVPEDDALDTSSLALTPEQEISDLRRKLQAQQQRVKHVTILLSESERECARMAQLAELLKSELRRVRGGSAGAHNTEYMKNVTFKFLTLPPGDERSRLVPVLQKILTLTSEETQKIQAVAKGIDPNSSKGWGSYLPWPGGK